MERKQNKKITLAIYVRGNIIKLIYQSLIGLSLAQLRCSSCGGDYQLLLLLLKLLSLRCRLYRQSGPSVQVQCLHGGNFRRGDMLLRRKFIVDHSRWLRGNRIAR